jgi:uncharacterized protein (TIGR02466 family)
MALHTLFATPIYEASLAADRGFADFLVELEDGCRMLAAEDRAGRAWCKAHNYGGYTSYASLNDLPRRVSVFDQLRKKLDRHAAAFAETLQYELGAGRLRLDSMWVNQLKPGAAHTSHIHPHSVLSGTAYVVVPSGASALKFEDPRLAMMMAAPPRRADADEGHRAFVCLQPQPGTVLMWESWLRHEVPVNAAKSERISISFNYGWK